MRVAHRAGTEPLLLFENVEGMKVALQAGTETLFSKNVGEMTVAH